MTDFQVGDRVSVEGVVTTVLSLGEVEIELPKAGGSIQVFDDDVTLVERPKRKLRVGSVWEPMVNSSATYRYHVVGDDWFALHSDGLREFVHRSDTNFDSAPDLWREVPVEELEQEAADGS